MASTRLLRGIAALLLFSLLLAPFSAVAEENESEDEKYERLHPEAFRFRRLLILDVPGVDRVIQHFERPQVQKALGLYRGNATGKIDDILKDPARMQKAATAAAELYKIGGFEAVHEALKRKGISGDGSLRMAQIRNEMLARAADRVAQKYGRLGTVAVNNFSVAKSVKSDIDFTLFPEWHQPKIVQPTNADGRPPTGEDLKVEFYRAFRELWKVKADTMEIAAHAAEAKVPDWRHSPDAQKFALEYRKGVQKLVENPEAYFLEGAYRMQVDRRTYSGNKPLYIVHTGNLLGEGALRQEHLAREKIYRSIPPDFRKGYAFGATVGNFHFFSEHPGDPGHFTKYVLRSVEDGMRLLHVREGDDVRGWQEFKDAPPEVLDRAVSDIYDPRSGSGFSALEVRKILRTAMEVRLAADSYTSKKWGIWKADATRIWRSPPHNGTGEPPADLRDGLVAEAEAKYEVRCRELMIENMIRASKARAADFTDAGEAVRRMKLAGHLPDSISEDVLRKNLRTSTLYECYLAFKKLDPEIRQRIVDSTDGASRRFLQNVSNLADARQQLFETPSHWKAKNPGFFTDLEARWDAEIAKVKAAAFDLKLRVTTVEPRVAAARMKAWTIDHLGKSWKHPMQTAEKVMRKIPKFNGKKLAARAATLGNADSVLIIIRAGQDSGWDPMVVGQTAFYEAMCNIPYVSQIIAAKGALMDGEFLGAGIVVAAYFCPVVGQVYVVGDILYQSFKIVDHTTSEGLVDMMIDGISPDEATGVLNTLRRMWGHSLEGIVYEEFGPSKFLSPLRLVPGATAAERRKNWFAYVDSILDPKLEARGFDRLKWDDKKMQVIRPFVGSFLVNFEKARGPFEEDHLLKLYWEEPISKLQKSWLADEDFRGRLINRLCAMYVEGLHRRSLEEGQKEWEKMQEDSLRVFNKMWAFEEALEKSAKWCRAAGEMFGVVDYSDDEIELPEPIVNKPRGKVLLIPAPGTKLEPNRTLMITAKVEEIEGKFAKPYHYRWSFGRSPEVEPRVGKKLEFVKVECGTTPVDSVVVRLEVRDANGKDWDTSRVVGEAAVEITGSGVVEHSGVTTGEGRIYILKAFVGNEEIGMEWHTVRLATPRRPIGRIVKEYLAYLKDRHRRSPIVTVEVAGGPFKEVKEVPPQRQIGE